MSHIPEYGIDKDLRAKREAKYDPELERQAREWITAVTSIPLQGTLHEALMDGTVLCSLVNRIKPGIVPNINRSAIVFKKLENISNYQAACAALGVPKSDSFDPPILFEAKDLNIVIQNIHALGRASQKVAGFQGPYLGVRESDANVRNFTEEQRRQAAAAPTFVSQGSKNTVAAEQGGAFAEDKSRNIVKGGGGPVSSAPTMLSQGSRNTVAAEQGGAFSEDKSRNIVKSTQAGSSAPTFATSGSSSAPAAGTAFQEDTSRNIVKGGGKAGSNAGRPPQVDLYK